MINIVKYSEKNDIEQLITWLVNNLITNDINILINDVS